MLFLVRFKPCLTQSCMWRSQLLPDPCGYCENRCVRIFIACPEYPCRPPEEVSGAGRKNSNTSNREMTGEETLIAIACTQFCARCFGNYVNNSARNGVPEFFFPAPVLHQTIHAEAQLQGTHYRVILQNGYTHRMFSRCLRVVCNGI